MVGWEPYPRTVSVKVVEPGGVVISPRVSCRELGVGRVFFFFSREDEPNDWAPGYADRAVSLRNSGCFYDTVYLDQYMYKLHTTCALYSAEK